MFGFQISQKQGGRPLLVEGRRNEQCIVIVKGQHAVIKSPMVQLTQSQSVTNTIVMRFRKGDDVCRVYGRFAINCDDS